MWANLKMEANMEKAPDILMETESFIMVNLTVVRCLEQELYLSIMKITNGHIKVSGKMVTLMDRVRFQLESMGD